MNDKWADARAAARIGPLFIVLNASAGRQEAQQVRDLIAGVLNKAGRTHEFLMGQAGASVDELARRAVEKATARNGVVVACGGDGTVSTVAHAVLGSGCPFAVVPQGTFNYFGRAHGISQDAAEATGQLLSGETDVVQVGRVNERLFLVNASLGLYPKLLEDREAYEERFGRSRLVSILGAFATLLKWRGHLDVRDETAAEVRALRTTTLFVGNNRLQLDRVGVEPEHAEAAENGFLTAVVVRQIGPLALLGLDFRGLLGRLADAEHISSFAFSRLRVAPRGLRRVKVALDGEVIRMRLPLVFEAMTDALLLLRPPRRASEAAGSLGAGQVASSDSHAPSVATVHEGAAGR
jgi:diacylglycerol kinase family enzyme